MDIKDYIISQTVGNLYWKDKQGKYLGCNQAFADLIGLKSIEDIIGKSDYELFLANLGEAKIKAIIDLDQSIIQSGEDKTVEETGINSKGEIAFYITRKVPLKAANGDIIGLIGNSLDITKQKQAEIINHNLIVKNQVNKFKLQKANHKLEGMLAVSSSIAHELRTPLAALSIRASNLQKYLPTLIAGYRMAQAAGLPVSAIQNERLNLLEDLIETMEIEIRSAFTFIDMQLMNLKTSLPQQLDEVFSLADCIQEALTRYPFQVGEQELIQVVIEDDFVARGKKLLIIHILFNLLKNALYYIAAAGKGDITITLQRGAGYNTLYFKDTGAGISEKILPNIFKRFFSKTQHGAGIGLTFCKTAMQAVGGSIECSSREGEYTLFTLSFPQ